MANPPLAEGATLVFPAIGQTANDYCAAAIERGERVVCASSMTSIDDGALGQVHPLPSIYDQSFSIQFEKLIASEGITRIFCPVAAVFDFMRRTLPSIETQVKLLGCSPIEQQISQHRALLVRARRFEMLVHQISSSENRLSTLEIASILRQATLIYGESNDEKLAALMAIFSSAPPGDVIEIGSLMGRSAFVLLYLAWRYRIGPVLSIDPWQAHEAIQHKSPKEFQALVDEWDFEVIADGFMINMIPFRRDDHAHLRMTSEEGFRTYTGTAAITSQLGQSIPYSRKVSVIHIDGNHDLDAVQKDCDLWLDRMVPGGWVVLDDYLWAHGDGPYRVGNKLLKARDSQIERSFVCGKALFIKFL